MVFKNENLFLNFAFFSGGFQVITKSHLGQVSYLFSNAIANLFSLGAI